MGRIKAWCEAHQIGLADLAARVGVDRTTLWRIDNGAQPTLKTAKALERETRMGIRIVDFVKDE